MVVLSLDITPSSCRVMECVMLARGIERSVLTGNVGFGIKSSAVSVLLQNSFLAVNTYPMTWDLVWASAPSLPSRQRMRTAT